MSTSTDVPVGTSGADFPSDPADVDNHDWLAAIDRHPKTTSADLLAAYNALGVQTDRTPEQLDASTFRLHLLGFLWPIDVSDDGLTYTYKITTPNVAA